MRACRSCLTALLLTAALVIPAGGGATAPGFDQTGRFDLSPLASEAYRKIMCLRFAEARSAIDALQRREPGNRIAPLIENYLDFLTVLVNDNRAEYARLAKNREPRLSRAARGDRKSPYFLYCQAEIRLQWAVLHSRYGHYLSALSDVRQAYALLEMNRREHPDFTPNLKSLGILHALAGNIPEEYRWAVRVLSGMRGSVGEGMQELNAALAYARQHDFLFEDETRIACAFLQLHLQNDKPAAWQTLRAGRLDPRNSPVAAFALANMALRTGRNDEAIRLLQECPAGGPHHPFPYRYYLLGIAKLNRLDPDANQPFEQFVANFGGENGLKEAYQKLAWFDLLQGNTAGYRAKMELVKTKGTDRTDTDKAALREAKSGEMPDPRLTRARLLFDGGYYRRAEAELRPAAGAYTTPGKQALEYSYRLGRIAHELGHTREAIRLYSQTVDAGRQQPWYFACNAALQLGLLYESQRAYASARAAFQRCLAIKPAEYAASLHARAKAGLARLPNAESDK